MKKLLLTLTALTVGLGAYAANELQYTLQFGADYNEKNVNNYTSSFNVKNEAGDADYLWNVQNMNNNNNGWDYVRFGRKKEVSTASVSSLTALDASISKVVVNMQCTKFTGSPSVNPGITSARLEVLATADAATPLEVVEFTDKVKDLASKTYTDISLDIEQPSYDRYYKLVFECPSYTDNGIWQMSTVKFYGTPSLKQDAAVAFPETEYTAFLGKAFDAPKATTASDGTLTYSSSDENVATVDAATGDVTLLSCGVTEITAFVASTDVYKSGKAIYTLTVKDPDEVYSSAMGSDFTFVNVEGKDYPWSHDAQYGLKGTAYVDKAVVACEGYAVSPVIDLTGKKEVVLKFMNVFNQYKVSGQDVEPADFKGYAYIVAREEGATEWTQVCEMEAPEKYGWDFYAYGPVSLEAFAGKKMQFAYKYVSTAECAGTWEIKGIQVLAKDINSSVESIGAEAGEAVYYNLQGVRVANPEHGIFIRVQGGKSQKVVL